MPFTLPRPLSHSSITLFNECPQKYKFKYIDKIPEKPRHFFSFGQSVHLALEFFYGVKALPAPTLDEVLAFYKENWVQGGYKDPGQEAQYFEDGKLIITAFYQKHIRDYALPFFVEYGFSFEVDGVPVTGKVDRVDKLPDGRLSIIDYKTGKKLVGGRVEIDPQLTMYQLAAEQLLGLKVAKLSFYHLPSLKEQIVERHTDELVDGLKKRIVVTAERITTGAFEPKPAENVCRWCDYKPLCPVFKPQFQVAAPPAHDAELAAEIDEYGDLLAQAEELRRKAEVVKARVLAQMTKKAYVRAFGKRFEVSRAATQRWEFPDKKKVLEIIKKAGLYDRILAPSAPKVDALMTDLSVDENLRARLEEQGARVETPDLKVKPL
jgi:RecB family exonuclease